MPVVSPFIYIIHALVMSRIIAMYQHNNYSGTPLLQPPLGQKLLAKVAIFQGLIYTRVFKWDEEHMAVIERWPQFIGLE